jgi:hypothetical protein
VLSVAQFTIYAIMFALSFSVGKFLRESGYVVFYFNHLDEELFVKVLTSPSPRGPIFPSVFPQVLEDWQNRNKPVELYNWAHCVLMLSSARALQTDSNARDANLDANSALILKMAGIPKKRLYDPTALVHSQYAAHLSPLLCRSAPVPSLFCSAPPRVRRPIPNTPSQGTFATCWPR